MNYIKEGVSDEVACKLYVDTGPVLERVYGKYGGLGWVGKNTCLIKPEGRLLDFYRGDNNYFRARL